MIELIKQLIQYFLNKQTSTPIESKLPEVPRVPPETQTILPPSNNLKISSKGLLELANREGLSQTKYLDSEGVETIGIGETKSDIKDLPDWPWDKSISVEEACNMFKEHIKPYSDAVVNALHVSITQYQFDALVSITYNIGIEGMQKSTFMKRINDKESIDNIVSAILLWKKPIEIIGRRQKEAHLFSEGIYSNIDGCVDHIEVNTINHKPSYKGRIKISQYF